MSGERRLFFALWPGDAERQELVAAARGWLGAESATPRFVDAANLHLTLAYLGPVAEARLQAVCDAAARVRIETCELRIDRSGWWRKPQVAWLAPCDAPAALHRMEQALWAELAPLGWHRDHPEFRPHISVVRKLRAPPPTSDFAPIVWPCNGFVLCQSRSTAAGVRYQVINRWPRIVDVAARYQ